MDRGRAESARLTRGQQRVLGAVVDRGGALFTPEAGRITSLSTADDLLRELRDRGLVMSERVPGHGNTLRWTVTDRGRGVLLDARWGEAALDRMKHDLGGRLSPNALAYALRVARYRTGVTSREPKLPWTHRRMAEQVHAIVDRYVSA